MSIKLLPAENNYYYVYTVRNVQNVLLYVGADKIVDIVSFKAIVKNPNFNSNETYSLDIMSPCMYQHEALNIVSSLIKDLCGPNIPEFNRTQSFNRNCNVICNETGVVYKNANEACKALNIHQPRMSNHLRNQPGHKTIKGMTFSYKSL